MFRLQIQFSGRQRRFLYWRWFRPEPAESSGVSLGITSDVSRLRLCGIGRYVRQHFRRRLGPTGRDKKRFEELLENGTSQFRFPAAYQMVQMDAFFYQPHFFLFARLFFFYIIYIYIRLCSMFHPPAPPLSLSPSFPSSACPPSLSFSLYFISNFGRFLAAGVNYISFLSLSLSTFFFLLLFLFVFLSSFSGGSYKKNK